MVIFPVGFPYNLQRAKHPYCRGIPLRVATLCMPYVSILPLNDMWQTCAGQNVGEKSTVFLKLLHLVAHYK